MNIAERAKDLRGHVGIYFKNLATGDVVNYNADDEYHPASVIKLPIVMAVYKMASEGKADLYRRTADCGAHGDGRSGQRSACDLHLQRRIGRRLHRRNARLHRGWLAYRLLQGFRPEPHTTGIFLQYND